MNNETRVLTGIAPFIQREINGLKVDYTVTIEGFTADAGTLFVILTLTDKVE